MQSQHPRWLSGLNEQQRGAVEHEGGPLLVLAGAGTGKTRTLICRLARLLASGVAPDRILLVTFSRRAAQEMVRRAGTLTDPRQAREIHAGTFHAMAYRTLRRYGQAVDLQAGFSVLDPSDSSELMALMRSDALEASIHHAASESTGGMRVNTQPRRKRFVRADTLVAIYSKVVNAQRPLEEIVREFYPWCVNDIDTMRSIFRAYTERKRAGVLLDFDDLLLYWRAATADPNLGPLLAGCYDHILVDEYQDTNILQADIIRALRRDDGRLTVVGDDAQAIYSFRAATADNLLNFTEQFQESTVIKLEQNYRSTTPILALANAVASEIGASIKKELWTSKPGGSLPVLATCPDESAQAEAVCDLVIEHLEKGVSLREQAVLFRSSHHSDILEVELRHRGIPFVKYGGLRFLEAAHIKDLVAVLRILENPRDELAWQRVLLLLEGIGPATVKRLMSDLGIRPQGSSDDDPLARFVGPDRPILPKAEPGLTLMVEALANCRAEGTMPAVVVDRLREVFDDLVRSKYDNPDARLADYEQLSRLAVASPTLGSLVADLTLDPPASTGDLAGPPSMEEDYLILSTVHSAKGGEWKAVHLIHAADGSFPSDMATGSTKGIDEERRLFYVALTRARQSLHIYAPLRYHHSSAHSKGDRHSYAQRTRFLPNSVDPLLEHRAVRQAKADEAISAAPANLGQAVDDSLRALW